MNPWLITMQISQLVKIQVYYKVELEHKGTTVYQFDYFKKTVLYKIYCKLPVAVPINYSQAYHPILMNISIFLL